VDLPTEAEPVRVVEGDCLELLRQLPDGCVGAVITDPPYGINCTKVGSGTGGKGTYHRFTTPGAAKIAGDRSVDGGWLADAYRVLRPDGFLFSFSRWDGDAEWHRLIMSAGFKMKNRAVWVKAHFGSGDLTGAFGFQHESVFVAAKGRPALRGKRAGDVWRDNWTECIRHGKAHPFEKPLDLIRRLVLAASDPGDLVLDPFGGSGTTAAACAMTGRRCLLIEREPAYAAIARKRVAEAMGAGSLFAGATP